MRINAVIGSAALAFTATLLVACGSSDSSSMLPLPRVATATS